MSVEQLADELAQRWAGFAALGLDPDLEVEERIARLAPSLMAQLLSDDRRLAGGVAADVMSVLWPVSEPPAAWWATSLGRVCAMVGPDRPITRAEAAAILGKSVAAVKKAAQRGVYTERPDGRLSLHQIAADE